MSVAVEHLVVRDAEVARVLGAIPDWWSRRARRAGLSPRWCDWRAALDEPPLALDTTHTGFERARPETIGDAYVGALAPAVRLREGRHYTPPRLAAALWREIDAVTGVRGGVVDPSCGAGALLAPYVRRRVRAAQDARATLDEIASSVAGTDLDPIGVWLGNALLAGELLPLWGRLTEAERQRTPLPRLLDVGDGLAPRRDGPQVIVMNPPYGRVRLEPSQRERWASTLYGHANRYALFLHAAVERAAEGGVVAAVIPTSFLGGAYFQRLRGFLARNAPLVRVVFVDARAGVFVGDVLQETCLAIFHKGGARADVVCGQVSVNGRATRRALPRTPARLERIEEPWLLPRAGVSGALVRRAAALRSCLADHGWSASTGPLVWNRHKVQISPRQAGGAVPILWGADIAAGRVARDVARDHQRFISLRPRDTFMRLDEPCVLVQRTTAPEQPRRLVAAVLDAETLEAWGGCVVVENHVNVLRSRDADTVLTPSLLTRLLNTATLDRIYRCLTGSVAVSAYELSFLPLPDGRELARLVTLDDATFDSSVTRYYRDVVR